MSYIILKIMAVNMMQQEGTEEPVSGVAFNFNLVLFDVKVLLLTITVI